MGKHTGFGIAIEIIKLVLFAAVIVGAYMLLKNYFQPDLLTEQNTYLSKKQPATYITYSSARDAMNKRDDLFQDPKQVSRLFLIQNGNFIAQAEIKGDVTSLNTKYAENANSVFPSYVANNNGTIDQGNNEGVFFFTTDGTYYEWKGDYLLDSSDKMSLGENIPVIK